MHAWAVGIEGAAWPVHHLAEHDLAETSVLRRVGWDLGGNHLVDLLGGAALVGGSERDQKMRVRQSTFLELDHMDEGNRSAKDLVDDEIFEESLKFKSKDHGLQVAAKKRICVAGLSYHAQKLRPTRICRHRNEEIRVPELGKEMVSVGDSLFLVASASRETW